MADTKIRGVTIELGADVQGITKGLKTVDKELKSTQDELKDINRLLKLDPTNTELLAQKHRALGDAVKQTETKLETLKKAQAQFDAEVKAGGTVNQQQYDALKREIINTEDSLKRLEKAADQSNVALSKVGAIANEVGDAAGKVADKTVTLSKAAAGMLGAAAGAAGKMVSAFADFEQLEGGVETLFGPATKLVMYNAEKAFKDAGLSANDYMETVTSFAASLISSVGGSTVEAAKLADMAIIDMSDNANKMGTSMELIQNAYQGFAKQNYTMLDNLKLGYGGTKKEMERLLADAQKITGDVYDINKYSDIVSAIHVIQTEWGITGTTAAEAEATISGSIGQTKAALDNLITGMGNADANVEELTNDVIASAETVLGNVVPILKQIWDNLPDFVQITLGVLAVTAAISPVAKIVQGITTVVGGLTKALSFLLANPMALLVAAVVGFVALIATKGEEIKAWLQSVDDFLQKIFARDFTETFGVLGNVINFFVKTLQAIFEPIKAIFDGIIDFIRGVFTGNWERAWNGIKEIFEGIVGGFLAPFKIVINAILTVINSLIDGINKMIDGLNKISIDVPDWVPVIGGKKFGFNIGHIGHIPLLGTGGVVQSGSAIVGESGAELLTMTNQGAVVQPLTATLDANSLAALQGGGGSQTVVTVNFTGSLAQLGRILQPQIAAETARIGGSLVR